MLGAILVVGSESQSLESAFGSSARGSAGPKGPSYGSLRNGQLASAEIIGRSSLERTIERMLDQNVGTITVLVDATASSALPALQTYNNKVRIQVVKDVRDTLAATLKDYSQNGLDHSFVARGNFYTECDLLDLFQFHREMRQASTRTCDRDGALDLWVVNCARVQHPGIIFPPMREAERGHSSYFIREYVNRLAHAQDLRRLVIDGFRGNCEIRPAGKEVRPGVWIDEGAQIHKRARIVAPAYVGRGSKIREDALITRCSNIESGCYVDYGTVVEDSSILANSYVGIWLDIAHAVVRGNELWNIPRDVLLEIGDSKVIRENVAAQKDQRREPMFAKAPEPLAFAASQ